MKTKLLSVIVVISIFLLSGCKLGKSKSGSVKSDGQLHGIAPGSKYNLSRPLGMVYVPPGTFLVTAQK